VSQKYGVEFRLLNPVACGQTWYGTYGYAFGKGSFGNTAASHRKAAERLRGFPLASVKADFIAMLKSGGAACLDEVADAGGAGTSNGDGGPSTMAMAIAGPSYGGAAAGATAENGGGEEGEDEVLKVIARYEQVMGQRYAPKTMGALVSLLLRLQRIVRRNDKAERLAELRLQRRDGRKGGAGGSGGSGGGATTMKVEDGFGAGHWAEADLAEAEGYGADRAMRRREEEREAAAKRKAGSASSLFEPLKFASKKASKLTKAGGGADDKGKGNEGGPTKVMSAAKPRALPTRPLRPRGADGLVPPSAPIKEEPASPEPAPSPMSPSATSPSPSPPPAKKQKNADKDKDHKSSGAAGGGAAAAEAAGASPSSPRAPSSPSAGGGGGGGGALTLSRWSDARIETASNACVEVLREAGGKWMPRQEVRALARAKVGLYPLEAPGFNPRAYQVKNRFQSLLSNSTRTATPRGSETRDSSTTC
jgi:hypothetical protein